MRAGESAGRSRPPSSRWGTQEEAFAFAAGYRCPACGALAQVSTTVSVSHYPACPRWRPPSQDRPQAA